MIKSGRIITGVLLICCGFNCVFGARKPMAEDEGLHVYIPRERVIKGSIVDLGSVTMMRGDEVLIAKASGIGLGRFSVAGQQIVIDRQTILSRLASNGFKSSEVVLSGASKVTVKRNEKFIDSVRFMDAAEAYIRAGGGGEMISSLKVISLPKNWIVPEGTPDNEIELVARKSRFGKSSGTRVWVGVVRNGVEIGGCDIAFRLEYRSKQAVAKVDIATGVPITHANTTIEMTETNKPEVDFSEPYGMVSLRSIRQGSVIRKNMIRRIETITVVKRRQTVLVKIEGAGFSITNMGEALTDGKVGEYIKVKMGPRRDARVIYGKVRSDGTITPVH